MKHGFYWGVSHTNVATLLTHELVHGLGFGQNGSRGGPPTVWDELKARPGFFSGARRLNKDGQHLALETDLMALDAVEPLDPRGAPHNPSGTDMTILRAMGYAAPTK